MSNTSKVSSSTEEFKNITFQDGGQNPKWQPKKSINYLKCYIFVENNDKTMRNTSKVSSSKEEFKNLTFQDGGQNPRWQPNKIKK